ncbi:biopolymer transporter Tol [Curtobacterium sp. MCBD17_035]|uniref:TolB family protein n=1 Tax=Curtobacterium sp. MCBD17_035 TaxID=2175673 RepID=UPI000DA707B9|nr:biopolymer transporter Tol [Curtobacterium sp. MCBD17_035]WIB66503.1 biopolymer transporter Tol [Curtobacterium sp. MCBD17_035]
MSDDSTSEPRGRQLRPGQTSRVHVVDVTTGEDRVVFVSDRVLVEAPNVWIDRAGSSDERLVLNGDGDLFTLPVPRTGLVLDENDLVRVPMDGVPEINNDHVLDPSGTSIVVSARDGDLYRVTLPEGTAAEPAERITDAAAAPVRRKFYLHGIAPDGSSLAAIVGELSDDGVWSTDVALVDPATGEPTFVTRDEHADDGVVFAPDGSALLWNSERWEPEPGHAQLTRLRLDGVPDSTAEHPALTERAEQLTHDERVNWFPHPSPDGRHLLYLAYPTGTQGHPADRDVELRMLPGDAVLGTTTEAPRTVAVTQGGQGTVNVPPWAPSSTWFAYCDYPVD